MTIKCDAWIRRMAQRGMIEPFVDGQVRSVCEQQKCRVSEVYKALGCAPKCGKCVPLVKELSRIQTPTTAFAEVAAA